MDLKSMMSVNMTTRLWAWIFTRSVDPRQCGSPASGNLSKRSLAARGASWPSLFSRGRTNPVEASQEAI
jgi:hypothetical protein